MVQIDMVHKDPQVESLIQLFDELLTPSNYRLPVQVHLGLLAERLVTGHRSKHQGISFLAGRKFGQKNIEEVFSSDFSLGDAQDCVAQDFGYENWSEVTKLGERKPDAAFEVLVDSLLAGDLNAIKAAISADPEIVHQRSSYPHRSTLLHYTGSNGVEGYRQVVPRNLVEIVDTLLSSGADPELNAEIYGGCTARELMKTSKHPYEAGLSDQLEAVFQRFEKQ